MNLKFIFFIIGTWFLFMILAIVNAGIRNIVYKPIIGELRAHQLSTFIFITLIIIVTYLVLRYANLNLTNQHTFVIGLVWLLLTICFEFIAGYYVFGNSWDILIADYNIFKGRIWSLVLITTFISPFITNKLL